MPNDTHVAKWGNSLAVRIPQAFVRDARLAEGDWLSFDLAADGRVPQSIRNEVLARLAPLFGY
jgi:antitoxin component of MazEF toxin-antitoxin module